MNVLDKLNLLEYYYEPINDNQFLYIKNGEVSLYTDNVYKSSTLEEVLSLISENKESFIDQTLVIQAMYYKKHTEKMMEASGINWEELTIMEKQFKDSISSVIKNNTNKKNHLRIADFV